MLECVDVLVNIRGKVYECLMESVLKSEIVCESVSYKYIAVQSMFLATTSTITITVTPCCP